MIHSLAFLGKKNEPLYLYTVDESEIAVAYAQSIIHSAIDVLEERRGKREDKYLNQISIMEDFKIFGYCSNSQNKVVVVGEMTVTAGEGIREFVTLLHSKFSRRILNPFQIVGSKITSASFHAEVQALVQEFNKTGM